MVVKVPRQVTTSAAGIVLLSLALASVAPPPAGAHGDPPPTGRPAYTDVTTAAGLGAWLHAGYTGDFDQSPLFPELTGSGACWLDYDQDGKLDLFLVNGQYWSFWSRNNMKQPRSTLFRNLGDGTFGNVAAASDTDLFTQAQGCSAADYDNDGYPDLYVTGWGGNVLYHNLGDGTFANVTASAGVRSDPCGDFRCWGSSANWFDADRDGCLDLYVDHFGDYDPAHPPQENGPESAPGQKNALYRGDCAGHFTDATAAAGLDGELHNSWASIAADLNGDGWPDLVVANDGDNKDFYLNNGDGTFRHRENDDRHGMGTDVGDIDFDGCLDIVVPNFVHENNALLTCLDPGTAYRDVGGDEPFTDAKPWSGWAARWVDFNNDAYPDLMVVDGMTQDKQNIPLEEPLLAYEHLANGSWQVARDDLGPDFARDYVGRGGAWADYNDDGAVDVVVCEAGERHTHLLRADRVAGNFLNLDLGSTTPGVNRDALGARVTVRAPGLPTQLQEKAAGAGFLSSNDPRLHFGLGAAESANVEVRWPDGVTEAFGPLRANSFLRLREGEAAATLRELPLVRVTGPLAGSHGQRLDFSAEVGLPAGASAANVVWDFDDGATAQGTAVSHAFLDVGVFTVRATATDDLGRGKTTALTVRVTDHLTAKVAPDHGLFFPWEPMAGNVTVRFSDGSPVRGAAVRLAVDYSLGSALDDAFAAAPPSARALAGYGTVVLQGTTDAEGRFAFAMPWTAQTLTEQLTSVTDVAPPTVENTVKDALGLVSVGLNRPGEYNALATGGARGSTYDPVAALWTVSARPPGAP